MQITSASLELRAHRVVPHDANLILLPPKAACTPVLARDTLAAAQASARERAGARSVCLRIGMNVIHTDSNGL